MVTEPSNFESCMSEKAKNIYDNIKKNHPEKPWQEISLMALNTQASFKFNGISTINYVKELIDYLVSEVSKPESEYTVQINYMVEDETSKWHNITNNFSICKNIPMINFSVSVEINKPNDDLWKDMLGKIVLSEGRFLMNFDYMHDTRRISMNFPCRLMHESWEHGFSLWWLYPLNNHNLKCALDELIDKNTYYEKRRIKYKEIIEKYGFIPW